eukprot:UC4_evm3s243
MITTELIQAHPQHIYFPITKPVSFSSSQVIKTYISVGAGPSGKLTHSGLRQRMMAKLGLDNGEDSTSIDLEDHPIFDTDEHTTTAMIQQERRFVKSMIDDTVTEGFQIDTTTTVITLSDGSVVLHSPAEVTENLEAAIFGESKLQRAKVAAIIAPNLQHWLGCRSWIDKYPSAKVFVAPPAAGESLVEKLNLQDSSRVTVLEDEGTLFDGQISYKLLKGAPVMMNEVLFFHHDSETLIVADAVSDFTTSDFSYAIELSFISCNFMLPFCFDWRRIIVLYRILLWMQRIIKRGPKRVHKGMVQ